MSLYGKRVVKGNKSDSFFYHGGKPEFNAVALHDFPAGVRTEDHILRVFKGGTIIIAAMDTHKEVFSPSHPAKFPTGDQAVLAAITRSIKNAKADDSVLKITLRANASVRKVLKLANKARVDAGQDPIDINDAAQLPGAVLVIVKIDTVAKTWEMFQACDGWCIRFDSQSEPSISPYRNARVESYHQKLVARFLEQSDGNKGRMWDLFFGPLCESRRRENNMSPEVVIANGTMGFDMLAVTQITRGKLNPGSTFVIGSDGAFYDPLSFEPYRSQLANWWQTNTDVTSFIRWNRELQSRKSAEGHVHEGVPELICLRLVIG